MKDSSIQNRGKMPRKITKSRLKNIGLYYLKRFESSTENLRQVLKRRVSDYARADPSFDKTEALGWIEEVLADFQHWGYLDDARYAELKTRDYLAAGKPARYIELKLRQKGINADLTQQILENQAYDVKEMALKFAKKKKIGPFRFDEEIRRANRQKDMATLIRAGFDYDVVSEILQSSADDDNDF